VDGYFGWPEAHDNDAERGRARGPRDPRRDLEAQRTPTHPNSPRGLDRLGTVVVGAGAGKDTDVFGDTPNIAAPGVQAAAAPGTVLISGGCASLVSGLFVVEDRGAQALKGIERPVQLYRVVQPSGVRGRLEAGAAARGLTPFVAAKTNCVC